MIKKIILAAIILIFNGITSNAQLIITITPASPDQPPYEGFTADYNVSYSNLPANYQFVITVDNGTNIPVFGGGTSAPTLIRVKWDCLVGSGSITLTETLNIPTVSKTLNTAIISYISDPVNYCSYVTPVKQNLIIGQTSTNLSVSYCSPYCTSSTVSYFYQWQVGDVPIGTFPQIPTSWANIPNANGESYQPPAYSVGSIKAHRRLTTFAVIGSGGIPDPPITVYSQIAVISTFYGLSPGSIGVNNSGSFTQTPATGGLCDGFNYFYYWELSLDYTNTWTVIGTNIDFPPGFVMPTTFAIIRRKVICGGEVGLTNSLYFNPPPLVPGSINYNGPNTLPYNTVPNISQMPASGGVCPTAGSSYSYTWERSIDNAGWVPIGVGITYPAGVGLVGNTRFRRKVQCIAQNVRQEAYSNILTFAVTGYTPPVPENLNYVQSKTVLIPGVGSIAQLNNLNTGEQIQETAYFDGLGRKIQTVVKQNSPLQKDMVSVNEYDQFGLESIKRLPFVSNVVQSGDVDDDGKFKSTALQQQTAFYSGASSPVFGQGETLFYSQTDFEQSPLNRVLKTFAPGNSWVGTRGTGSANEKSGEAQYLLNTKIADAVKIFTISSAAGSLPTSTDTYNDGELYKTVTIDEAKHQVVEFKDKQGNIILKKVQLDDIVADGHTGWLCTYYVYDDFNLLRFVIPPKATEAYLNGESLTDIADELCFNYEYDSRHRLIMKKVPGAGKVWMVYDLRDRLVMMQDGNLGAPPPGGKKWMVTEYDALNRPWRTGLLTDNNNQATHAANASNIYPYPNVSTGYEILTETYYDNYNWTIGTSLPPTVDASSFYGPYFEVVNSSPLYASPLTVDYNTKGLITGSKVKVLGTANQYEFNINFYDDRGRVLQTQNTNLTGGIDITTTQYDFSGKILRNLVQHQVPLIANPQTHLVLSALEYDHAGRLMTIRKLVRSQVNAQEYGNFPRKILVRNTYDELGQLKTKKLGVEPDNITELETLVYDYNIRGWLLGMNRDYLIPQGQSGTTKFGFELGYDKINNKTGQNFYSNLHDGNITGMIWKSDGDDIRRKYDFSYDNVSRLLKADFEQHNEDGGLWDNTKVNFGVKMGDGITPTSAYDANGNILAMTQFGLKLGVSPATPIDNLTYSYFSGGNDYRNKLQQVLDANNDKDSKLGDFKYDPATKTATDYTYDANGNLITDLNKSIINYSGSDGILYNHLNLPAVINVKKDASSNKGTINYTYDAMGNKLQKIVAEADAVINYNNVDHTTNVTTTTDYIGGFIYETKAYTNTALSALQYNYTLQSITHEEGRMRLDLGDYTVSPPVYGGFKFDFFIKDHLGNVRMVITDEKKEDMYPAATMEDATAATEELFYSNLHTRVEIPDAYPQNSPTGNAKAAKLNGVYGGPGKMGPGIVLKVMAGDKFNAQVNSWYYNKVGAPPASPNGIAAELLDALINGVGGLPGTKATPSELYNSGVFLPGINSIIQSQTSTGDISRPWAFLNWVLFDEQFNYVSSSSGFDQVPLEALYNNNNIPNNNTWLHVEPDKPIDKSGFLYIYVSNETPNIDVFFDNLQVTHIRGSLLEETHYYPFGLTMAGISSKAVCSTETKQKFVSQELDEELDINLYQFTYRNHDPQIGRFIQIDPLADAYEYNTTYAYAENRPINGIDLEGLEFLYTADGNLLWQGADKTNRNVYITTNDIVTANTVDCSPDWSSILADKGTTDFTGLTGVNKDLLVGFAATIDNESGGALNESYAIGNVSMNFIDGGGSTQLKTLDDIVMYDNSFAQGSTQANYTSFNKRYSFSLKSGKKTIAGQNKKYAVGAAINAVGFSKGLSGFSDYSNGATGWDGVDLIISSWTNSHRNYKWSEDSKTLLETYKKDNKGGVDVSTWTYVKSGYEISATKIIGKTLYQKLHTGRGEKKQNKTKFN